MTEFKVTIGSNHIDPKERSRRLSKVYELILSWPDPLEQMAPPAADFLGRDTATGGETEVIHPAPKNPNDDAVLEEQEEQGDQL